MILNGEKVERRRATRAIDLGQNLCLYKMTEKKEKEEDEQINMYVSSQPN